jgi:hypothetical protein
MHKLRAFFKSLFKLSVAAICMFAAVAAYRFLLHPLLESAFALGEQASSTLRRVNLFATAVLSYWAFVHYWERRAVQELSLRWRWIGLGALAGCLSIGVSILVLYATGHYELVAVRGFGQLGGALVVLWIAAVLEELAFRGILFRILEEGIGTRAAWIGCAVIFSLAHLTNPGAHWVTLISVALAGLMWTAVFILWRNVWVVAAHHFCWNATIFMIGVPLSGEDMRAQALLETVSHGSILWTGGGFGPEDSLVNVFVSIAICTILWRLVKQARVEEEASAPAAF